MATIDGGEAYFDGRGGGATEEGSGRTGGGKDEIDGEIAGEVVEGGVVADVGGETSGGGAKT